MRRLIRPLKAAICVSMLSACSALPKMAPEPGTELPSEWAAAPMDATANAPEGAWWRGFGDPDLVYVVETAVGENFSVWQADAQAAQARAAAVIAGADRLPTLGAGLGAEALRNSARNPLAGSDSPTGDFRTTDEYGLNLSASWELDLWGRLKAQSEAGRQRYLASVEGLRAVRQSIAAQTAKAYFAVVEQKQQVALSQRTLEVIAETARQVGNRADVGIASPSDKFLAASNRDSAAAGLAVGKEALGRAARILQRLTTDYPDGEVRTAAALPDVPPLPGVGVPADLLARRPDIIAAERNLRASGFDTFAAEKALLPAISLTGALGTQSGSLGAIGGSLADLLKGDFGFWTLAGNLIQPIFQGGRLRANVELNDAAQREAANAYADAVLTALAEVETALAARTDIEQREMALCDAAESARLAEQVSFNRYRQGVEPFLTVLTAQQRTLDASSACIAARRARLDNNVDLHLALGGGFEETPEPPESIGDRVRKRFEFSEWNGVLPGAETQ